MTISSSDIKKIINAYMPRQKWVSITDIQSLVKTHYSLSKEDEMPHTNTRPNNYPLWKHRIQGVLSNLKANGVIQHDIENNEYFLI
ncbi:hypothetical protein SDC9_189406 [bioreactor metagenome]|uniref:Restriction system protein Mrr-like N-terminal domain-containing protein n=1 Tax=bioreactor metagenome TaxID=1076179 RepID=A0A645HS30_9ZZZZ